MRRQTVRVSISERSRLRRHDNVRKGRTSAPGKRAWMTEPLRRLPLDPRQRVSIRWKSTRLLVESTTLFLLASAVMGMAAHHSWAVKTGVAHGDPLSVASPPYFKRHRQTAGPRVDIAQSLMVTVWNLAIARSGVEAVARWLSDLVAREHRGCSDGTRSILLTRRRPDAANKGRSCVRSSNLVGRLAFGAAPRIPKFRG
jgi:hypothetical protein